MKIQVVIEATSIQEYTEAIQALAAGYTVAPVNVEVPVVRTAKQEIESDVVAEDKSAEESNKKSEAAKKAAETRKRNAEAKAAKEAEEKEVIENAKQQQKEAEELEKQADKAIEESTVSFIDVKQRAIKHGKLPDGKADVKFVLEKLGAGKLSDLTEDKYETFMAELDILEEQPKQTEEKPVETGKSEESGSDDEAVTLEMIRSKAKELSVAGYKDEIKAALKEIGAVSLTKIPKNQYDSFYAKLGEI